MGPWCSEGSPRFYSYLLADGKHFVCTPSHTTYGLLRVEAVNMLDGSLIRRWYVPCSLMTKRTIARVEVYGREVHVYGDDKTLFVGYGTHVKPENYDDSVIPNTFFVKK
jgi:hypothetical protein